MNARTADTSAAPPAGPDRRNLRVVAVTVAVALHVVVLVPFTVGSGLVAPWPAIAGAYLLWLAMAGLLWGVARRRPLAAPLVPLANAGLLFALITFGESVLGWMP
jgi:hypothetical protein